jgi:tetratricopeptide (TPR) repeat protein
VRAKRVTFKYGLGDQFIGVLKTLHMLGLDNKEKINVKGVQMAPRDVVAACLPDPAHLGEKMHGKTCAGTWVKGWKDGSPREVYLYQVADNQECMTKWGCQAVVAQTAFSAVIARDSNYADAWNGLAKTYLQAQRRQFALSGITNDAMVRLALAASDRAIAIDSGSSDAWLTRALASRALDPTQERGAIQGTQRAIALDSGNAEAWHQLGVSQLALGEPDQALTSWRESVRRKPTYTEGLSFLALAHYWHRQFDSAAHWADSAVAVDESFYLGRATAGYAAIERGEYVKATAEFEAACADRIHPREIRLPSAGEATTQRV